MAGATGVLAGSRLSADAAAGIAGQHVQLDADLEPIAGPRSCRVSLVLRLRQ